MRKLPTVLNAVNRDQVPWQTEPLSTAIHTCQTIFKLLVRSLETRTSLPSPTGGDSLS